jgi:hypothetical protein
VRPLVLCELLGRIGGRCGACSHSPCCSPLLLCRTLGAWTFVGFQVEKGKIAIFTAKCPQEGCPLLVGDDVFRRYLKPDALELYDRIMLLSFIEDCANLVRCPSPHCTHVIGVSKSVWCFCVCDRNALPKLLLTCFPRKKRNVRCECGFSFCFRCQGDAHAPATCDQLRDVRSWGSASGRLDRGSTFFAHFVRMQWQQREEKVKKVHEIERASKKAGNSTGGEDNLKVKPCPNPACRIPTTKISGCMYLTCTKCGVSRYDAKL